MRGRLSHRLPPSVGVSTNHQREEGEGEAERSGRHRVGRAVGCPEGVFLFVLDAAMVLGFCGQAR